MTDNNVRSFRSDDETDEYLDQQDNVSAVVRRALKAWKEGGEDRISTMEIRADRLRDDIANLENQLEGKRDKLSDLEEKIEKARNAQQADEQEQFEEAVQLLKHDVKTLSSGPVISDMKRLKAVADKFNVDEDELYDAAVERWGEEDA